MPEALKEVKQIFFPLFLHDYIQTMFGKLLPFAQVVKNKDKNSCGLHELRFIE